MAAEPKKPFVSAFPLQRHDYHWLFVECHNPVDISEVYEMVRLLEPDFNQTAHPNDVLAKDHFRTGVSLFDNPTFSTSDLLNYAMGDNPLMAYMALEALSRRETDPQLSEGLLKCYVMYLPWGQFFVMRALLVHVPPPDPLIGDLLFLICRRESNSQIQSPHYRFDNQPF